LLLVKPHFVRPEIRIMNKSYRLIYNDLTNTWVAVSETAKGRGKRSSGAVKRLALAGLLGATALTGALAAPPNPPNPPAPNQLPTGGQVVAGQASISQSAATLTVNQNSNRAAVDWQTFNVGSAATVNFNQPSAASVTLNRVLDANPSQIFGRINANGQVFLSNPNGVFFAPGASVDVGALVATTHTIGLSDFMAGNANFERNGSTGSVINEGELKAALGGYIALLAPEVRNSGVIVAQAGTVALASGEAVTLHIEGSNSLAGITVQPSLINALVENKTAVLAPGGLIILSAQAAAQVQGGVIKNSGSLEATGLVNDGGRVVLEASDRIEHTGSIKADAAPGSAGKGGTVTLIANLANANSLTTVDGSISAKGGSLGGDGGFVETSGGRLKIGSNARIDTSAVLGKIGTWLLDPVDFTIAASGGDITGATLGTLLDSNSVTIETATTGTNTATNRYGINGSNGDIFVNDPVSWSANTALTLNAYRNININQSIAASGSGSLTLTAGAAATIAAVAPISVGGTFTHTSGIWNQVASSLPAFSAQDFRITGGSFIRATNGDGSSSTPYLINDVYGLQGVGSTGMLGKYYALAGNIDASGTSSWNSTAGFAPIGNSSTAYTGTFDGLGHTISNLTINRPATDNVALFGVVGPSGAIQNVGVSGSVTGSSTVGGLVGYLNTSSIISSYFRGSVRGDTNSATGNYAGGLVGSSNSGTIQTSYADAQVTGANRVGGLLGQGNSVTVTNTYSTGAVTGNQYVGGLIGLLNGGTVSNTYATGAVTGTSDVGGLLGNSSGTVNNSFWDTVTTGKAEGLGIGTNNGTAGVAGTLQTGVTGLTTAQLLTQANYTPAGTATGQWDFTNTWYMVDGYTRPFLRSEYSTTITNAHQLQLVNMNVAASYTLANNIDLAAELANPSGMWGTASTAIATGFTTGFVPIVGPKTYRYSGMGMGGGNITQAQYDALTQQQKSNYRPLTGAPFSGTFDGLGHTISNLTINLQSGYYVGLFSQTGATSVINNVGMIAVNVTGYESVGALVGSSAGQVSNSFSTGIVSGHTNLGGLIGYQTDNGAQLSNSYSSVNVTGTGGWYIGGLMGTLSGSITDSYATGDVTGGATIGGLVGQALGSVSNSYASGKVSATSTNQIGGLIGVKSFGTVTNSFWDTVTTGQATSAAGTGMTTAQLLTQANYTSATVANGSNTSTAWDFANTWYMVDGSSRPFLRMEYSTTITNAHQLQLVGMNLAASYTLANNIDLAAELANPSGMWGTASVNGITSGFAPIGNNTSTPFTGSFDGLGHVINHLTINTPSTSQVGLFGVISGSSVVQNIGLENVSVSGLDVVGGLVGFMNDGGAVSNSSVTGTITGAQRVGGLVGGNLSISSHTYPSINTSHTNVTVVASGGYGGGLIGRSDGSISNSYSAGTVTSSVGSYLGGLVGQTSGDGPATISNSYSTASVTSAGDNIGGLLGGSRVGTNITNSYATGDVSGRMAVGGLVGYAAGGTTIIDSYARSNVTGTSTFVGGLVGAKSNTTITNSYYDIDSVSVRVGDGNGGSMGGSTGTGKDVTPNGLYTTQFNGWLNGGGGKVMPDISTYMGAADGSGYYTVTSANVQTLLGYAANPDFTSAKFKLSADVALPAGFWIPEFTAAEINGAGYKFTGLAFNQPLSDNMGLIGVLRAFRTVTNLGVTGTASGHDNIGGLVGNNDSGTISNSYASVQLNGKNYVGGLVGNNNGPVSNSYAAGQVTGTGDNVGGLLGVNGNGNVVSDSYATGAVQFIGGSNAGGLVGSNYGTINNSYATGAVTGSTTNVGGLVGANYGTVNNSFYDSDINGGLKGVGYDGVTSSPADVAGTVWGMSTAALKIQANFTSATGTNAANDHSGNGNVNPGWGFGATPAWKIVSGVNNGYPCLAWSAACVSSSTPIYLDLITNTSVYGDMPVYTFGYFTSATWTSGMTAVADALPSVASPSGASYLTGTPPTVTSDANTYSLTPSLNSIVLNNSAYVLSAGNAVTWTVTQRPLTITAGSTSRVYGHANPTVTSFNAPTGTNSSGNGLINGDTISSVTDTIASTASAMANAGTSHAITPSAESFSVGSAGNYAITYTDGALTISKAYASLTAARPYDGSTALASSTFTVSGVNGETLTLGGSGMATASSKNVADNATNYVSSFGSIALADGSSGTVGLASNYQLPATSRSASNSVTLSKANLTLAPVTDSKTYDGTQTSTATVGVSGKAASDTVTVAEEFASKNAMGSNASTLVIRSGYTILDGSSADMSGNYTITANGTASGTIGKAHLTVTADNQTRLYGQSNPTLTETISGFVNGETLASSGVTGSANAVGTIAATPNTAVGQAAIAASTIGLLASNYDFAASTTDGTLTINKAHLTVTADNQTRLYGQANPNLTETITGFVNNENLATSGVTGSATGTTSATPNTAVGQAAIVASTTGLLASNYDFTATTTDAALTINKAHLTVTADNQTRLYGQTNPTLTETISGFVNNENLATSGVTGSATGTTSASANTGVGHAAIAASTTGLGANNYDFAASTTDGTLTINKAHLTVTADNQSRLYGQSNPTLTETISGFVNGETLATSGVTGSATGTTNATPNTAVGQTAIAASTTGLLASNYDFAASTTDGTLTINKAHLTVTANDASRDVGQVNPDFTATLSGFVNSETLTSAGVSGSAALSTTADMLTPAGTSPIAVAQGTLGAHNYDFTAFNDGILTIKAQVAPPPPPTPPVPPPSLPPASGDTGTGTASNPEVFAPIDPVNPTTPGGPAALGGLPAPTPAPTSTGAETVRASGNNASASEGNSAGSAAGSSNNGISVNLAQAPTVDGNGLVAVTVPKDTATAGAGFGFALPTQVVQSAAGATIEVTTTSGEPLPAWLKFVPESNSFVATAVPDGGFPFQVLITVAGRRTVVVVSERKE
jgi:filamentous hemagglutinin family protein